MLIAEYSYETDIKVKQQEAREDGIEIGISQGQQMQLIQIICKNLSKGRTPAEIAEFLDDDLSNIEAICAIAKDFAPDYDSRLIFKKMNPQADPQY